MKAFFFAQTGEYEKEIVFMAAFAFLFYFSDGKRTSGGCAENNVRPHVSRRFE